MTKQIKMTSIDGITLHTANKYVTQDIHITNGLPEYDGTNEGGEIPPNRLVQILNRTTTEITFDDLDGATILTPQLFYGLNLTKLEIPKSVKTIGGHLLCSASKNNKDRYNEIYYDGTFEDYLKIKFNMWPNYYDGYSTFFYITPNFYMKNEEGNFYNFNSLSYVKIPDSILEIKEGSLNDIRIDIIDLNNVTKIERYCFTYSHIKTVIANNATSINSSFLYSDIETAYFNSMTDFDWDNIKWCYYLKNLYVSKVEKFTRTASSLFSLKKIWIEQTDKICQLASSTALDGCYHIIGKYHEKYNPNSLKDGYVYVPASRLVEYKIATNWSPHETQIIGHQDFIKDDLLPNYTNERFTKQTWYSDEALQNIVTNVDNDGCYYCKLEV